MLLMTRGQRRLPNLRVWVLFACLVAAGGCGRKAPPPNVLLVTLDTTRADRLGCYGYREAETPALDSLASEGVLFERAYTTVPLTLPAHASMLTGLYPPEHGLRINGAASLSAEIPTVAKAFHSEGYRTGAFVAAFVLSKKFGLQQGFEVYDDDMTGAETVEVDLHQYRNGRLVVDAAARWLAERDDRPFFCWVHLYDPHAPYHTHPELFRDRFEAGPYDAELAFADLQVKRLLDHLDAAGARDRTVVAVVGDHGEGLGDHAESRHGYQLYDSTLRVPMIFSQPGVLPAARIQDPVSVVSLPATLLEVATLDVPLTFPRASLVPSFHGQPPTDSVLYAETDGPFLEHGWSPQRAVVTRAWKYIRSTRPELYQIAVDPGETANLASDLRMQAQDMDDRLYELESSMRTGLVTATHLSEEDRQILESLGYAGRRATAAARHSDVSLPDIKEKIHLVSQNEHARSLIRADRIPEGLALLRATVAEDPNHGVFHWELGRALHRLRRHEEALAAYQDLLALEPDSAPAHNQIGLSHYAMGELEQAEVFFLQSLRLEPDSFRALANLAVLYMASERSEEALRTAEKALALQSDSLDLRRNLAIMLEKKGKQDEALSLWLQVLEQAPLNEMAARRAEALRRAINQKATTTPTGEEKSPSAPE